MKTFVINSFKGASIGLGALLPGISGASLATIFGIYEPLIAWLANPLQNRRKNIKFFFPYFLGAALSIFLLANTLTYLLAHHEIIVTFIFVGVMLGIMPALVKESGRKGRKKRHVILSILVACGSFYLFTIPTLQLHASIAELSPFFQHLITGQMLGIGITFPGVSPSNYLMYLGLYSTLNTVISTVNIRALATISLGLLIALLLTAKLMKYLLKHYYATVFHLILGLVLTSIVLIVPRVSFSLSTILYISLGLLIGIGFSRWLHQSN